MGFKTVDVNGEAWQYLIGNEFVKFVGPRSTRSVTLWDFLGMTELEWRRKMRDDHNPPEYSSRKVGLSNADIEMYIRRNLK